MRIAITMPTGKVGSKLVDKLLDQGGHELTLLTTDSARLRAASDRGARVVQGKLEDMSFVSRATEGVDSLFFVLPMDSHSANVFRDSTRIIGSVCNAIRKNAIDRVVFVSSIGTHLAKGTGPIHYLKEAEQKLAEFAPNLTVLRPVFYMDQLMGWVESIADEGAIYSPLSATTPVPMIATRDIADFAADVLTDDSWTGRRNVSLHGPREYSYSDISGIMSRTLDLEVRYVQVEPAEMAKKLRRRGWSEQAIDSNLEMLQTLTRGDIVDELPRAEWTFRPTTFEEFMTQELQPAFEESAAVGV